MKGQCAAALLAFERDAQPETRAELALERHRVGVANRPPRARHSRAALDQPLGSADVEPAAHDLLRERLRVGGCEQSAGVAGREDTVFETAAHRSRQR